MRRRALSGEAGGPGNWYPPSPPPSSQAMPRDARSHMPPHASCPLSPFWTVLVPRLLPVRSAAKGASPAAWLCFRVWLHLRRTPASPVSPLAPSQRLESTFLKLASAAPCGGRDFAAKSLLSNYRSVLAPPFPGVWDIASQSSAPGEELGHLRPHTPKQNTVLCPPVVLTHLALGSGFLAVLSSLPAAAGASVASLSAKGSHTHAFPSFLITRS